jgi:preprotein translocase subunit SecG
VLTTVLVVVHLIAASGLLVFVLLHAGRGGGLSDLFGGGSMGGAMAGSTVVEKNLDRLTVVAAIVFTFTTIMLGIRLK